MAVSPSQLLRESIDKFLLLDDDALETVEITTQVEKLAWDLVRNWINDASAKKYLVDRLLGRAAVSADVSIATPQDLDRHIDNSLKGYAAEVLKRRPTPAPAPAPKLAPVPTPPKRIGIPPRVVKPK